MPACPEPEHPDRAFLEELPPLPLSAEMRTWDEQTQSLGIPATLLMENAGFAAARLLASLAPNLPGSRAWCLMGAGNNGGDAACLARHIKDMGADPTLLLTRPPDSCRGAAAEHLRMALACGVRHIPLDDAQWDGPPPILVDGLLGTGFQGELRDDMRSLIERLNAIANGRLVFSLDVPTGLDADAGVPRPIALRADATVCFGAARPGLCLPAARQYTGTLHVAPIGIPQCLARSLPCSARLLDAHALSIAPSVPQDSHKHTFGHVLVIGGAEGMQGAALLAARGALRAGAGLVTVASPAATFSPQLPEVMTCPLNLGDIGEPTGRWPDAVPAHLLQLLARCRAVVIGPGMGRDASSFLRAFLEIPNRPPAAIDADALRTLGTDSAALSQLTRNDVLTPHPGEAAALLGRGIPDRRACLDALCELSDAAVVLKGAGTLVGQRNAPMLVSPYDVPQLAVAGSGDVLAGVCGAALGEGLRGIRAAAVAVCLHALAGKRLAEAFPCRGNTASEIADAIPPVRTPPPPNPQGVLPWPA